VKVVATVNTACLAGIYSGVTGYFLGPWIDHGGVYGLLFGFLFVILPAYFPVFGTESRKGGRWHLDIETLKRGGAWLLGVAGTGTAFQLFQVFVHGAA
jgi:hypothetical protein